MGVDLNKEAKLQLESLKLNNCLDNDLDVVDQDKSKASESSIINVMDQYMIQSKQNRRGYPHSRVLLIDD